MTQTDNNAETGGGWQHDVLNDSRYTEMLAAAVAGEYHALMIAHPCSPHSFTRFFDASDGGNRDPGPPVLFTKEHPDGLPESEVDPRYHRELRNAKKLLERVAAIAVAARRSSARTTIVFENPADRSILGSNQFAEPNHGAVFGTSAFLKMAVDAELTGTATFAYCRLGSTRQKYTTLYYTPDAAAVLDELNLPQYQCNHPQGWHSKVGGRDAEGRFSSHEAATYPEALLAVLARAFTLARTGSDSRAPAAAPTEPLPGQSSRVSPPSTAQRDGDADDWWQGQPTPPLAGSSAGGVPASAQHAGGAPTSPPSRPAARPPAPQSPIAFPSLGSHASGLPTSGFPTVSDAGEPPSLHRPQPPRRSERLTKLAEPFTPPKPVPKPPSVPRLPPALTGAAYQKYEDEVRARVMRNRWARGAYVPTPDRPPEASCRLARRAGHSRRSCQPSSPASTTTRSSADQMVRPF